MGGLNTHLSNAAAYAAAFDGLISGASTVEDLSQESGLAHNTTRKLIHALRRRKLIHVAAWEADALGRHTGMSNIPALKLGAWSLAGSRSIYYLIWVLVGLACLFSYNVLQSRAGRAIRGLRGGSTLLASVGADAFRVRRCVPR